MHEENRERDVALASSHVSAARRLARDLRTPGKTKSGVLVESVMRTVIELERDTRLLHSYGSQTSELLRRVMNAHDVLINLVRTSTCYCPSTEVLDSLKLLDEEE